MGIKIILASHGLFAFESLKTAEMIIGNEQDNVKVVSVTKGRSYEECLEELQSVYKIMKDEGYETLILTDIFGGTPSNISSHLALTESNIQVYSGFNIPILLEILLSRPDNLEEAKNIIETSYRNSLIDITKKLKEGLDNGNRLDTY